VKRYDHADGGMAEDSTGEYVRYEETKKHVEVLQSALVKLAGVVDKYDSAIAQRDVRITELEAEIADLIHPHDMAAYRTKKSLHK
jgi:hypothetical protein